MKKIILSIITLAVSALWSGAFAQARNDVIPQSWSQQQLQTIDPIALPAIDMEAIRKEDEKNDKLPARPFRFGVEHSVNLGLDNAGVWDELPNGDRIWRLNLISEGAKTMNFIFDRFYMPPGAAVYLYNNARSDLISYDASLNRPDLLLGTWTVDGDNIWVEYHEPKAFEGEGQVNLETVVHGYRSVTNYEVQNRALNDSGDCHLDVDCSVGPDFDPLKNQLKNAVAHLIMQGFICSGSLINNVNNDKKPYFLTAAHCDAGVPATWAFRFKWISPNPSCATIDNSTNSPNPLLYQTSGSINRANNFDSDFRLLEIQGTIPPHWGLSWPGWNRSASVTPQYGVGIHHPSGDIMKVSRTNIPPQKQNVNVGDIPVPVQSWRIMQWNMGATEGGSSGSPLFNQNGQIIGQLSGGSSECVGTINNGSSDFYGRMDISWDYSDQNWERLDSWLDPDNTGVISLDGLLSTPAFDPLEDLAIYPNPARDAVFVMNNRSANLIYEMYDAQGRQVKADAIPHVNNTIGVRSLSEGIYFLKVYDNATNSSVTKKIIVKR